MSEIHTIPSQCDDASNAGERRIDKAIEALEGMYICPVCRRPIPVDRYEYSGDEAWIDYTCPCNRGKGSMYVLQLCTAEELQGMRDDATRAAGKEQP